MISEVEEIKDQINIADLMSEYIKLTPAGANFRALCPFHNEKTPSLIISPEKKIFKCFGCGAGGDIFEFLMKIEGLEFPEAKKVLAKKAGVVLKDYDYQSGDQKSRLLKAMELAKKYYHYVLLNSASAKPALDYLKNRGLTEDTIIDWQIGYSPDGWSNIYDFLKKRGFSDQEIFLAGLALKKKTGFGFYDRFRGRIMFPIDDVSSSTVAFTARVSPQNEATETMGKYINSPQTDIYDKSRIVFALSRAKSHIKEKDSAVIVEGQMDAITAHQNGFNNVVASSGTALTIEQFKLIKRYTNNFLFALDADLAGQNATLKGEALARALDLYIVESIDERGRKHSYIDSNLSYNISVKIVEIKEAKDPDEMIKKNPEGWQKAVSNARPIIEYYFDKALEGIDPSDVNQQLKAVRQLLPQISKINSKVEVDYWLKRLAQKIGISEDILREERAKLSANAPAVKNVNTPSGAKAEILPKDLQLFRKILAVILKYPAFLGKVIDELLVEYLYTATALDLYKRLVLFYTKSVDPRSLLTVDNSEIDLHSLIRAYIKEDNSINNKESLGLLDESFLLSGKDFDDL
ncbi:MAG: DNA primase, partial [Candidatus Buchananbacteria bacterium]|nr:DNA primase [Candidatus Buchananbacteria bacterium]